MANTTIGDFRENISTLMRAVIDSDEPLTIATENGRTFLLSESYYKSLLETHYICSVPHLQEEILARRGDSEDQFVGEEKIGL